MVEVPGSEAVEGIDGSRFSSCRGFRPLALSIGAHYYRSMVSQASSAIILVSGSVQSQKHKHGKASNKERKERSKRMA